MKYSAGLKFGYGVFETLSYTHELEDFDQHMARLDRALEALNMPPIDHDLVRRDALKALKLSGDNAIRISVYKGSDEIVYETRMTCPQEAYQLGYSSIIRHSSNPLLKIKSSCHLNNFLEKMSLKTFDELLHFNEKQQVTEGIYTNIFFVKDGCVYTPDESCGLLAGIYRAKVIQKLKKLGIEVKMGYYYREDIESADEIFMTNALVKIVPVNKLNENVLPMANKITRQLMKEML